MYMYYFYLNYQYMNKYMYSSDLHIAGDVQCRWRSDNFITMLVDGHMLNTVNSNTI